jgi:hypothetical protein
MFGLGGLDETPSRDIDRRSMMTDETTTSKKCKSKGRKEHLVGTQTLVEKKEQQMYWLGTEEEALWPSKKKTIARDWIFAGW